MSKIVTKDDWSLGADNIHARAALPSNRAGQHAVREAVNFDIVNGGEFNGRIGYEKILTAGTAIRGLAGLGNDVFFLDGTALKRYNLVSGDLETVQTGFPTTGGIVSERHNEELFMIVCGSRFRYKKGVFRQWGVDTVVLQPTCVAASGGALAAGDYKIAMTRVNSYGEESGTLAAKVVTSAAGGKITVSGIPAPPTGGAMRIYASTTNGTQMYMQFELTASTSTVVIGDIQSDSLMLETQFCREPPIGSMIASHHGVLLIAADNVVWMTLPMRPHICAMATGFFQFAAPVTNVISADAGIYITADETFWITDVETQQPVQKSVHPFGAVPNTALETSQGVTWMTEFGQAIGDAQGNVSLPNKGVYAPVLADDAVAGIVRRNGNEMAVTVMTRGRRSTSLAVTDYFDVEVIGP